MDDLLREFFDGDRRKLGYLRQSTGVVRAEDNVGILRGISSLVRAITRTGPRCRSRALEAGANEYIMKPLDKDIIANKLAEVVQSFSGPRGGL